MPNQPVAVISWAGQLRYRTVLSIAACGDARMKARWAGVSQRSSVTGVALYRVKRTLSDAWLCGDVEYIRAVTDMRIVRKKPSGILGVVSVLNNRHVLYRGRGQLWTKEQSIRVGVAHGRLGK